MILGIAHVALGCEWNGGFMTNYSVPSSNKKWHLMRNKATYHDLVVGMPALVPIELVKYNSGLVPGKTRIRIKGRRYVEIRARDVERERDFLSNVGFYEDGVVKVGGSMPSWRVSIRVIADPNAPIDPPLDVEGYQAIAFYTTDIDGDADRLMDAGGRDDTEVFSLNMNGRDMEICMLRSPEGTIVELIKIIGGVR